MRQLVLIWQPSQVSRNPGAVGQTEQGSVGESAKAVCAWGCLSPCASPATILFLVISVFSPLGATIVGLGIPGDSALEKVGEHGRTLPLSGRLPSAATTPSCAACLLCNPDWTSASPPSLSSPEAAVKRERAEGLEGPC